MSERDDVVADYTAEITRLTRKRDQVDRERPNRNKWDDITLRGLENEIDRLKAQLHRHKGVVEEQPQPCPESERGKKRPEWTISRDRTATASGTVALHDDERASPSARDAELCFPGGPAPHMWIGRSSFLRHDECAERLRSLRSVARFHGAI